MIDDREVEVKSTVDPVSNITVLEFTKMKNQNYSEYIFYLRDQLTLHKNFIISFCLAVQELNKINHMP